MFFCFSFSLFTTHMLSLSTGSPLLVQPWFWFRCGLVINFTNRYFKPTSTLCCKLADLVLSTKTSSVSLLPCENGLPCFQLDVRPHYPAAASISRCRKPPKTYTHIEMNLPALCLMSYVMQCQQTGWKETKTFFSLFP